MSLGTGLEKNILCHPEIKMATTEYMINFACERDSSKFSPVQDSSNFVWLSHIPKGRHLLIRATFQEKHGCCWPY